MKKIALLFLLISALASASGSGKTVSGTLMVAFGHVRDADGSIRSIAGLKLPFVLEPIKASKIHVAKARPHSAPVDRLLSHRSTRPMTFLDQLSAGANVAMFDSTIYSADAGSGYGIIGDTADPSSMDDLGLSSGSGQPWKTLTFGFSCSDVHSFLLRWIGYTSYVTGRGHDVSAFDGNFCDFGVIFPASQIPSIGEFKVTINVAAAGVVAPSNTIYLCQQMRTPDPTGEGAFDQTFKNVYNVSAPVNVGTSENSFWYDWDPLDGIYAEDEIDYFGDTSYANILFTIVVGGVQDTLVPYAYNIDQGAYSSGGITDLWYSDDSYLRAKPMFNVDRSTAPLMVSVNGLAQSITATSFRFVLESAGASGGGSQLIKLWNYTTNAYDVVDTRAISSTDATVDIAITTNPTRYINQSNRQVKAQVAVFPPVDISRAWDYRIDRANWIVTHP